MSTPAKTAGARPATDPEAAAAAAALTTYVQTATAAEVLDVLRQMPEPQTAESAAMNQALEEYETLVEQGQRPELAEFCLRFAPYESEVYDVLHCREFFDDDDELSRDSDLTPWPQPGQTFLGFSLRGLLGGGSFSRVYLATEPAVGKRLVVVKVSQRGAEEAQALGQLVHRNIVLIHSIQTDASTGLTGICMPYLGSATLGHLLARIASDGAIPERARTISEVVQAATPAEAIDAERAPRAPAWRGQSYVDAVVAMAVQLADALDFVHAKGIFHRDLKPSNVLLGADGRPLILDFNVATDRWGDSLWVGGSLPYMSPEKLRGRRQSEGGAEISALVGADLFALGVMIYELLAGKHPYGPLDPKTQDKNNRDLLLEWHPRGPQPLQPANPRVDRRLARIVENCLAYDPNERPRSAKQLAASLRRCIRPDQRLRRWVANHFRQVCGAALLVLVAAAAGVFAWSQREPYSLRQWHYGQAAYRAGQYAEAGESFSAALDEDPNLTEALVDRGRARQRQGEFESALADFRHAAERKNDGKLAARIAGCLAELKEYKKAAWHYEQAILMRYAPAAVYNNLGYCYLILGDYKGALKALDTAVEQSPDLAAAFHNRALARRHIAANRKGGADAAAGIADIEKAIALGPVTADLLRDAARLYVCAHQLDAALNYARRAIDHGLDPGALNDPLLAASLGEMQLYKELKRRPPPPAPPLKAARLLDPLND